jgi:hypothetical protein
MPTICLEQSTQTSDLVIEEFDGWSNPPATAQIALCICWAESTPSLVAP